MSILNALRYQKNKDQCKKLSNDYYHANKEKMLASQKRWRMENPDISKASMLNWQRENKDRMNATAKIYRSNNLKRHTARQSKRKASQLQRTPKWADLDAITSFFTACPKGLTVDHVIPLQGKLVSGLHVLNNLQYLTMAENVSKNNKFDPENWEEPKC